MFKFHTTVFTLVANLASLQIVQAQDEARHLVEVSLMRQEELLKIRDPKSNTKFFTWIFETTKNGKSERNTGMICPLPDNEPTHAEALERAPLPSWQKAAAAVRVINQRIKDGTLPKSPGAIDLDPFHEFLTKNDFNSLRGTYYSDRDLESLMSPEKLQEVKELSKEARARAINDFRTEVVVKEALEAIYPLKIENPTKAPSVNELIERIDQLNKALDRQAAENTELRKVTSELVKRIEELERKRGAETKPGAGQAK